MAQQPPVGQGPLIIEASRSHSDTLHSVVLLWMSDQPDTENFTWQHTTLTRDRHLCPPVRFEPAVPAVERPQTHTLDRAATGIGTALPESLICNWFKFIWTYLSPLCACLSLSLSPSLSLYPSLSLFFTESYFYKFRLLSLEIHVAKSFAAVWHRVKPGKWTFPAWQQLHEDCRTDVTKQNNGH
jgi:hypothetical protein